jgi:hypothetical protein
MPYQHPVAVAISVLWWGIYLGCFGASVGALIGLFTERAAASAPPASAAHTYIIAQNPPTDTITRTAAGTPTVTIQFSSIMHLNEQRGTVAGNPPQAADLAFPSTIEAGHHATLSGRLVGTGELSLSVDWGDGSPVADRTPNREPFRLKHKYTEPGTYHVRAVWTDSSGQSGFRELTITVTSAGEGDDD